jgi:hypothetical protein
MFSLATNCTRTVFVLVQFLSKTSDFMFRGVSESKHGVYHYEHAFALNWNAMKGYHYLMRLAHLLYLISGSDASYWTSTEARALNKKAGLV